MKKFINQHKFLLASIGFTILALVIFNLLYIPHFETNDDLGMSNIIYGYSTNNLNIYLVYINVIVGVILKGLLTIWPNYPWYTLLQYSLVTVSYCSLIYLIVKKFGLIKGMCFSFALTLFMGYGTFISIQFTRTASICTLAGVLLLFDAINDEKKSVLKYCISFILIVFGSMYRFTSFMMILIMLGLVGIQFFIQKLLKKDFKGIISLCLPFICIFAICFGCRLINNYSYQRDPVLKEYKQVNKYRANVMDYSLIPYDEEPEFYESIGMNRDAYNVSRSWLFADPSVFNLDTFKALSDNMSKKYQSNMNVSEILIGAKNLIYLCRYMFFPSVILGIVGFICCFKGNKKNIPFFILEVFVFMGIELYLFYRGRYLISRVQYGLFLELFMILALCCIDEITMKKHKILRALLFICCMSIGLYGNCYSGIKEKHSLTMHKKATSIVTLEENDRNHKFINIALGDRLFDIFSKKDVGMDSNVLIFSGWRYFHPSYFENLELNGYTNTYKDMVDDDAWLATSSNVNNIRNYIRSNYYPDAKAIHIKRINKVNLYKLVTKDLDLSNVKTVDGRDICKYSLSIHNTVISGDCYIEGENSFSGETYIGIVDARGIEHYYYTLQTENYENGLYSAFSTHFNTSVDSINLYYKINSTVYKMGDVQYKSTNSWHR